MWNLKKNLKNEIIDKHEMKLLKQTHRHRNLWLPKGKDSEGAGMDNLGAWD